MRAHIKRSARQVCCLVFTLALCLAAGCADHGRQNDILRQQLIDKEKQTTDLQQAVVELRNANGECRQQVATLQGLTPEQRREAVPDIEEVVIVSRSGIYDAETPGKTPRLIVYFRPMDDTGDAIKSPGSAHIELWDLGRSPSEALLEKWDVSAVELKKTWAGSLLSNFYRLEFPVPAEYASSKELTVKLTFTDYFTGKSFTPQQPIKSR